jgi:group II intron reverse transcriptase/maturase
MKPTIEILEKIRLNSIAHPEEMFTRLYRYLLRPDIYFHAYKNLYANQGAATKGVNNDTADGFSEHKVARIIKALTNESYSPKSVRRTYIDKGNGKLRPLGIPTFTDKLVQEVLRMILEAVYEPVFLDCSHGFRPKKSCHTALKDVRHQFHGVRWFVEGDIKGCFDNIDHSTLIGFVGNKIKDARLIKLLYKFLKAGYIENWQYNRTYSGTPQGGNISPILANIYLHELDKFVIDMAKCFAKPRERKSEPAYAQVASKREVLRRRLKTASLEEVPELLKLDKELRSQQLKLPCKSQTDKRINYIRYADDFLIGVVGSREDSQQIKTQLKEFIGSVLKMELSEEKTLITHSNDYARFLGYDVRVRRCNLIGHSSIHGGISKRVLSNMTELNVPLKDKIERFMFDKGIVEQRKDGTLEPVKRGGLIHLTDLEIVDSYNAELRGICNYYNMASNFCGLHYFAYLMEYSCLKTLAAKHKSKISKVVKQYRDKQGSWGIPYKTKTGKSRLYFARYQDCKKTRKVSDTRANALEMHINSRTTFDQRLKARKCELCGSTESDRYEIHHVNKVKNLKGKIHWERVMISKNRKTMVLCYECHHRIHKQ